VAAPFSADEDGRVGAASGGRAGSEAGGRNGDKAIGGGWTGASLDMPLLFAK
jgi:hypothetical protein